MPPIHTPEDEVPSAFWRLLLALIRILPEKSLSRLAGKITDIPVPRPLRRPLYRAFAGTVGIDLSEVGEPLTSFPSLNAFFVRRLKPGIRQWPGSPSGVASPVDGIVGQFGPIVDGVAIQAKGHTYSVNALLGNVGAAEEFRDGSFLTIYLSPRHYHRIHTPIAGTVPRATYIPGSLYPVALPAVQSTPGLFARNERLVCYIESPETLCAIAAIGAMNVGRISATFDAEWGGQGNLAWATNKRGATTDVRRYDPPVRVDREDEIMAFHLGSTVVLLFQSNVALSDGLEAGGSVQVGDLVAEVIGSEPG